MVDWPEQFGTPVLSGIQETPDDNVTRTEMESGVTRMRQRFTYTPTSGQFRWIMNEDVLGYFEAWFKHKAKFGSEWINMEIPTGKGMQTAQVRFKDSYTTKVVSYPQWEVTANVEIRELPTYSEAELDVYLSGGNEIIPLSDKFHKLVHEKIPGPYNWSSN